MTTIRTERLVLRSARKADLGAIHAILSLPQATTYWSTPAHETLAETQAWLDSMLAIEAGEGEDFIIERDGEVIGKAGFYRFPEIGFILHPDQWGRGYAREALQPLCERAFAVHGLEAIEADVDPGNAASLGLLKSLGFVETGREKNTMQIGGEWKDSVYLSLSPPETRQGG